MSTQISHVGTDALTALITLVKGGLNEKVDKAGGKVLSSNDFTTEEKTKLAGLQNTTVVDALNSTDAASALSANQGKVLDEKITAVSTSLGDYAKTADMTEMTEADITSLWNSVTV